ncbi:hypothetical protein LEMLEM_LOCUS9540 [Lemmus lemmus]
MLRQRQRYPSRVFHSTRGEELGTGRDPRLCSLAPSVASSPRRGKERSRAAALFTSSVYRCRHRWLASLTLASLLGGWVLHPPALSLPCGQACEDQ